MNGLSILYAALMGIVILVALVGYYVEWRNERDREAARQWLDDRLKAMAQEHDEDDWMGV
jgi:hypothetical protein